jgi:hypothetical protein
MGRRNAPARARARPRIASAYAKEGDCGRSSGMSIAAAFERVYQRPELGIGLLLGSLQLCQHFIGLLLGCFQPYQHFHAGQNQFSDGRDFAIMLIDPLLLGQFSLSAG